MLKNIKPKLTAISVIAIISVAAVYYVNYLINKPLKILNNYTIPTEFIFNDQKIALAWTDGNEGENLIIQSDKKEYSGFNTVDVYFSITNISNKNQEMDVVIWLEEGKRSVERIEKLDTEGNSQTPLVILSGAERSEESQVENDVRKTTDSAADQRSFGLRPQDDKEEAAQDDKPNDGLQNSSTALRDYGAGDARKDIKGFTNGYAVNDEIDSGQTNYYKATIKYPTLSKGEFFIEAFGYSSAILSGAKRSEESQVKNDVRKTTDSAADQRSFGLRPQDDEGESGNDIIGYGHLDPWYSSSWTYKRAITLQGSKIATTTTAFPVLATTTLADLKTTANGGKVGNANGYDIIFVDSDDSTLLNYEREKYDGATGEIAYWIKTDIASSTNKTIYMYYGNAGASDTATTTGVWDNNFVMVNHLAHNGIATTTYPDFLDSTKYANNGSSKNMNAADLVNGQVDGSLDFDGADDYVNVGDVADMGTNDMSISIWYKTTDTEYTLISKSFYGAAASRYFLVDAGSGLFAGFGTSLEYTTPEVTGYNNGLWHNAVVVFDRDGLMKLYLDNVLKSSISIADQSAYNLQSSFYLFIGRYNDAVAGQLPHATFGIFSGLIDEVRVSNTARTAGWITTEYNNQSNVGSFMAIGAESWGELDITTAPKVIKTGVESTAFTVQIPHNAVSDVTVNLSSDSSGTNYFASTTGGTAVTAVTIQTGSSSVNFYYKDYKPGAPTITVSATNFTSDTQQQMVQGVWQNTSYQCRRQITLQGSKIATTTTAFPVLATTTLADLKTTANGGKVGNDNGYDIIFVDSDDSTLLNYEREKYASTTGEIAYWIKTDIASSTDKTIYMYYGNAGASDTATTTGVWDNNFVMVNHLAHNGIATTTYPDFLDSTKYANNGSSKNMNAADLVNGQVDGSLDFDGVDDYVNAGNGASLDITGNITLSAWAKVSTDINARIMAKHGGGSYGWLLVRSLATDSIEYRISTTGSDWNGGIAGNDVFKINTMYNIITTYDNNYMRLYINGIEHIGGVFPYSLSGSINIAPSATLIAKDEQSGNVGNGLIDEVRVSNTARTAGWIKTEYNNQSNVGSFMAIGAEVCMPVPATRSGGGENVKTRIKGGVRFRGGSRF